MKSLTVAVFASILLPACVPCLYAQDVQASPKSLQETVDAGAAFLTQKGQAENGSFSEHLGLGPTGLALTALLQNGRTPDDPAVAKGLKYLLESVQPDGGIYKAGTFYRNYETSTSLTALAAANRDGKYDEVIRRAEAFLKKIQWDESEDIEPGNVNYGGAGYGSDKRPDLSNTSFLLDALKSAGYEGGRSGDAEGARLRLAVPESGNKTQHDSVRQGRTPTAVSTTPAPPAARVRRAKRLTAACGAIPT